MAAVAIEVLGAGVQRPEQVKAGDAPPRPLAVVAVERDQDRRPVIALDDPRGDDPDTPGCQPSPAST